jgi:tetratricopeptide (TPR) repeat protein
LGLFVAKECPDDLGVVAGMAVVFFVGGFFLMFFNRELLLNVLLERGRRAALWEFQQSAQTASQKVVDAIQLPGKLDWESPAQQDALGKDPAVQNYVAKVEAALRRGDPVDLKDIKQTAIVYTLGGQNVHVIEFLKLARSRYPDDLEIAMMLAKAFAELDERQQAIATLTEFKTRFPGPSAVDKLLGFYLLWEPTKLQDSIRYTSQYLTIAPTDDGAIFNLACAYSQLFGQTKSAESRQSALQYLKEAISVNGVWRERAIELTGVEGDFVALKDDPEFLELTRKSTNPGITS